MEGNVIDEMFNRISSLEEENKILEMQLSNLKVLLEDKTINDLFKGEKLDDQKIINELEEYADKEINQKLTKSEKGLKTLEIEYFPFDNVDKIYIAGDFTKWEQIEMQNVIIYL
jgi:hypothetical protein